jgi:hypothetical protein
MLELLGIATSGLAGRRNADHFKSRLAPTHNVWDFGFTANNLVSAADRHAADAAISRALGAGYRAWAATQERPAKSTCDYCAGQSFSEGRCDGCSAPR